MSSVTLPSDLERTWREHDREGLAALEKYLQALPAGPEAIQLGRALARYYDQRGWCGQAESSYKALLRSAADDPSAQAGLYLDLAEMAHRWGDLAAMQAHLESARPLVATLAQWALTGDFLRLEGLLACEHGDRVTAQRDAEQALRVFTQHDYWPGQARTLVGLSYILLYDRQFDQALKHTQRVLEGDPSTLDLKVRADALSNHGYALRRIQGDEAALPFYEQALELQMQRRDPLSVSGICVNLAELYRALGWLNETEATLERGLEMLKETQIPGQSDHLYNALGNVKSDRADYEAAIVAYERALEHNRQQGHRQREAITCANLGDTYYHLGDWEQAAAWREQSGELYAELGQVSQAIHQWIIAARWLRPSAPQRAHTILSRALKLAAENELADTASAELALRVNNEICDLFDQYPQGIHEEPPPSPPPSEPIEIARSRLEHAVQNLLSASVSAGSAPVNVASLIQAILEAARQADVEGRNQALRQLRQELVKPEQGYDVSSQLPRALSDVRSAGVAYSALIAMLCGAIVEAEADPHIILEAVLDRTLEAFQAAAHFVRACQVRQPESNDESVVDRFGLEVAREMPHNARAWNSLDLLCKPAIAMLARSVEGRRQARKRQALVEGASFLSYFHPTVTWLRDLLQVLDDEELLVLHPEWKRGYRVKIVGVADNFQLHLLLAHALIGDPDRGKLPGQRPDPCVVRAARGYKTSLPDPTATGVFNLVSWRGLLPDQTLSSDHSFWIWGEGTPADIPVLEGVRVILLGPPPYERAWNAGPKFSGMIANLIILDILRPEAVEGWLARIAAAHTSFNRA